ncbi:transposase [Paraburkholderia humisilvae]|uniref:transposase n=1 Tax=Paraburkholderia humisilvae TaxID=627669 RepID=UPI001581B69E
MLQAFATFLAPAAQAGWVVVAKRPFGDALHVLDYLGRYTPQRGHLRPTGWSASTTPTSPSGGKTINTPPR